MIYEENNVILTGVINSQCIYSHENHGEKFYYSSLSVVRESGTMDIIPLMISDKIFDIEEIKIDSNVTITGSIRTFNEHIENERHLKVYIYVEDMEFTEDKYENNVNLTGYICKKANKRTTPLGRVITDTIIAVNRPYGKSDYIPCIFWGKNARYIDTLPIGTKISLYGRFQSRTYIKNEVTNTVCEVSVQNVEILQNA